MKLLGTMENRNGQLYVGGVSYEDLARDFSTPLYVFDQKHFERTAGLFLDNFKSDLFKSNIIYASKAFSNLYIAGLASQLGLKIDVVSGGELYTALKAGYKGKDIYLHGNNKLEEELALALDKGVGTIVVDNPDEYKLLSRLAKDKGTRARVLLRINPIIQASTHKYIQTTTEDSKFGMPAGQERTMDLIRAMDQDSSLDLAGIHCHIGSQVLDEESFYQTAEVVLAIGKEISQELGRDLEEVNLGGGFGVYYSQADEPIDYPTFLSSYIKKIEDVLADLDMQLDTISIEPGRALVSESGSTLYTVGAIKEMEAYNDYIFVDGGMTDNPRPALYQAKYEADLVSKLDEAKERTYTIAGKCCESGDILIEDIQLAQAQNQDLLVVSSTGAYNFSMASNYNRLVRPGVVAVKDGQAKEIVKRQTYEDLISGEIPY